VETLPHYLRPGLRIVWIGYNPSLYSAAAGHYYARPGNVFWRQLSASGLVARPVGPEDDALLPDEAGIGFTDLCSRPTARASSLSREEIRLGAQRLYQELLEVQPGVAVFNGRGVYLYFHLEQRAGHSSRSRASAPKAEPLGYGAQEERVGQTRLWVVPSSSGLASRWHRQRLAWLRALADELEQEPNS
jgi:double-stranded uracil-DNA glycosylase